MVIIGQLYVDPESLNLKVERGHTVLRTVNHPIQEQIHANNKLFVQLSFHQVVKCASVHILTALENTPNCARNNLVGLRKEIRAPHKYCAPLLFPTIVKVAKDLAQIALAHTRKLA